MYEAPHEVKDQDKFNAMVAELEAGRELPPVLVCGEFAFSGSHRLAAWAAMEINPAAEELEDEEYCAVMEHLGFDPVYDDVNDFEEFLEAAHELGFALNAK